MHIAYPAVIREETTVLLAQEQHLRGTKAADRVQFFTAPQKW